jgi:uncharacterized membrane protein YdjX (TVP38/TMEM64 family)
VPNEKKLGAMLRIAAIPVFLIAAILIAWKLGYFELDKRQVLLDRVQRLRLVPGIELMFIASLTLVIILCLPITVVTILGGAIFGPWLGAALTWIGGMIGTVVTHWLSKKVAHTAVRKVFGDHRLLRLLRERGDVKMLFRLRVLPVGPFGLLDYLAGIANVRMRRLFAATALGMLPSVVAYSFVGNEVMDGLVSPGEASRLALWIALGVTALMLILSIVPRFFKREPV